jgi:hypothetical protein
VDLSAAVVLHPGRSTRLAVAAETDTAMTITPAIGQPSTGGAWGFIPI